MRAMPKGVDHDLPRRDKSERSVFGDVVGEFRTRPERTARSRQLGSTASTAGCTMHLSASSIGDRLRQRGAPQQPTTVGGQPYFGA